MEQNSSHTLSLLFEQYETLVVPQPYLILAFQYFDKFSKLGIPQMFSYLVLEILTLY